MAFVEKDGDFIEIDQEEEYMEYAPQEILQELHKMGHEIIGLVVKIMEAPVKNAHYTNDISLILDDMEELFKEYDIKGDGNTPQALAQPLDGTRTLSELFVDMAQVGISELIDGFRRDD